MDTVGVLPAADEVARFKIKRSFPQSGGADAKSVFPHPIALAATFNERLIKDVGEAFAKEVLAEGVRSPSDGCICFNAEMGNHAYGFGQGVLSLRCAEAFAKGLEKGGAVAFPSVNYNSEAARGFLRDNISRGLVLGVGNEEKVDIACFRGLIYGKSNAPLVIGDCDDARSAEEITAKRLADLGIPTAGVYNGNTLAGLAADAVEGFAERIRATVPARQRPPEPTALQTGRTHDILSRVAEESVTLIKNDGCLPLGGWLNSIAVIGRCGGSFSPFGGVGVRSETCLQAIGKVFGKGVRINYLPLNLEDGVTAADTETALAYANASDAVFIFMDAGAYGENLSYRRGDIKNLVDGLSAVKQTVAAVFGAPTDVSPFENANAVILGWYAGECAARQIINVICGSLPFGKLPYKIVKSVDNVGNRAFYPFGHGLCYTSAVVCGRLYKSGVEAYLRNRSMSCIRSCVQVYRRVGEELTLVSFKKVRVNALERLIVRIPVHKADMRGKLFIADGGAHNNISPVNVE